MLPYNPNGELDRDERVSQAQKKQQTDSLWPFKVPSR